MHASETALLLYRAPTYAGVSGAGGWDCQHLMRHGTSRARVSDDMRRQKSVLARPSRGMNAPCNDRRDRLETLIPWPCHVDPLNTSSDPAGPQADTSCAVYSHTPTIPWGVAPVMRAGDEGAWRRCPA